jgi:hypothetical protein
VRYVAGRLKAFLARTLRGLWFLSAGVLFGAGTAAAHSADVVYVQLSGNDSAHLEELVTMTPATLLLLAPIDANGDKELSQAELDGGARAIEAGVWDAMPLRAPGGACLRSGTRAIVREGYVELDARFDCGRGELGQTFRILSVLPAGYRVVMASDIGGARRESFALGDTQLLTVPDPRTAGEQVEGFLGWLELGVLHILRGNDHIAFLLALLLMSGSWRQVLVLITSFTVAHSLTLGAGAMGWIPLDEARQRWAEVAIAFSVLYLGAENLFRAPQRHRAALTFAFGLVHGLGFASALHEHNLGASPVLSLTGFNLGVEVGQAALVCAFFPVVRLAQHRTKAYPWVARAGSFVILCAGGYWMVTRLAR